MVILRSLWLRPSAGDVGILAVRAGSLSESEIATCIPLPRAICLRATQAVTLSHVRTGPWAPGMRPETVTDRQHLNVTSFAFHHKMLMFDYIAEGADVRE